MHDMMQLAPSGDLRTRMETMHEKMDAMMEQMSGSCHSDTKPSEVPAPADKQDHEEHHIPPQ